MSEPGLSQRAHTPDRRHKGQPAVKFHQLGSPRCDFSENTCGNRCPYEKYKSKLIHRNLPDTLFAQSEDMMSAETEAADSADGVRFDNELHVAFHAFRSTAERAVGRGSFFQFFDASVEVLHIDLIELCYLADTLLVKFYETVL